MSTDNYQPLLKEARELLAATDVAAVDAKVKKLRQQTLKPGFWDLSHAQEIMQEISLLDNKKQQAQNLSGLIQDLQTSQELLTETADEAAQEQLTQEAKQISVQLQKIVNQLSLARYLSGPYDQKGAILSIHPGQGGTEAMDWSEMLERMYLRYFERKDWKYSLISETHGDEAGIKEAVFEVKAPYAYGYLKGERGTHRLIRQSPFNADNLRQTSFSLVEVMPVINHDPNIKLNEEDLSWHFTRSGGPGGQAVNKTNNAVELTHEASGITVKSRESRSQVQNKETALKMLKAQLALRHEQQQENKIAQEKGQHQHASWGTQIRNYVLHPYQLVKDTRTEVETSNSQAVLDGDLDMFIEEEIKL